MFVTRVFVPAPIDKLLIVVDAVLLALGALFIKSAGATSVAAVGGVLIGIWLPAFLPFSFIFTLLYGVIVDAAFFAFKVKATKNGVNRNTLMIAMTISTLFIGFLSYYSTSLTLNIIPITPVLTAIVLFMAPISGAVAGYATSYLWNKYLRNIAI